MYKDTKQKICEKVFDWENKETTKDKEKRNFERWARKKQRENTERQTREQVDLGRTRGKTKRQRRHSKKENIKKFFLVLKQWRDNKKGSVQMSQHKYSKKKVFSAEKKGRNISPFQKKKVQTHEKHEYVKK